MTKRKTIEVSKVLNMANHFLAAKNTNADEREAVCSFLESVLFETKNYVGFRYLDAAKYPEEVDGLGSRRYYYPSALLQEDNNKIKV
jgi:hypothetical protein